MALIPCPECNTQISDRAAACIKCGAPIMSAADIAAVGTKITTTQGTSKRLKLHSLLSGLLTIVGVLVLYRSGGTYGYSAIQVAPFTIGIIWFIVTRFRIWWHHS